MIRTVDIAKWIMKLNEAVPVFDEDRVGGLREVFNHRKFLDGSAAEQQSIMLKACESKYMDEVEYPFDNYFGFSLLPQLENKSVLDLGCGTGGRTAAWFKNYKFKHVSGLEIDPVYIQAARNFAKIRGLNSEYKVGFGEDIPFDDESFDAVLSFDVLEHVADVPKTLAECRRVLKPNGKLFLVFPTYYQPREHHLGLVTKVPGLQLFFSGKTLVRAYYEIIEERGSSAYWYRRDSPVLVNHEVGNTINGTSFREFQRILRNTDWGIDFLSRKPIGSIGRSVHEGSWKGGISTLFIPLTYIPGIQEIFLHRVTTILRKT